MNSGAGTAAFVCSPDDARFARLYRGYYPPIWDFCRRRVVPDLVDDAVAETFLTAWRRLDDVPDGDEALVWLYGVAYRVIGHQFRATARRRRLDARLRSVVVRPASAADESLIEGGDAGLVLAAAARLGDTDAEVLRLAVWEQLAITDIAAILDIAPNAVKQRLHRAKRNLGREYRRLESRLHPTPDAPTGGSR